MRVIHRPTAGAPGVIHAPDFSRQESLWERLQACLFAEQTALRNDPDDPLITPILFRTKPDACLAERTLVEMGCRPMLFGVEHGPWKPSSRIVLMQEALQHVQTRYVLYVDGYDCLCLLPPQLLLKIYQGNFRGVPVVYGAELPAGRPEAGVAHYALSRPGYFKHLNTGCFIGETAFLRPFYAFLAALNRDAFGDSGHDQAVVQRASALPDWRRQIGLDHAAQLFLNLGDVKREDVEIYQTE